MIRSTDDLDYLHSFRGKLNKKLFWNRFYLMQVLMDNHNVLTLTN